MRDLSLNEINAVSGAALDLGQTSFLTSLSVSAVANFVLHGALKLANASPAGFIFNYVFLPGYQIATTAAGNEFFNRVIAPRFQK